MTQLITDPDIKKQTENNETLRHLRKIHFLCIPCKRGAFAAASRQVPLLCPPGIPTGYTASLQTGRACHKEQGGFGAIES